MKSHLIFKLLISSVLVAACAQADVSYSVPANTSDSDGTLSGTVDFFLTNCNVSCDLNIEFTDTQSGSSMSIGQAMSGVSFELSNTGTSLGSLSGTITNGSGGKVESVTSGGSISYVSTTPSHWKESLSRGGVYDLTTIGGGAPVDLIAGTGAGSGTGPGFNSTHSPALVGPVVFEITGIQGLGTSTEISDVSIAFGTGPDKTVAETAAYCLNSGNAGNCSNGTIGTNGLGVSATPEPFSFLLAGSGLIGLALIHRRLISGKPYKNGNLSNTIPVLCSLPTGAVANYFSTVPIDTEQK